MRLPRLSRHRAGSCARNVRCRWEPTKGARRRPIVLTSPMDGSPQCGLLCTTTLWHFDAAERAPSTASKADISHCNRHDRFTPEGGHRIGEEPCGQSNACPDRNLKSADLAKSNPAARRRAVSIQHLPLPPGLHQRLFGVVDAIQLAVAQAAAGTQPPFAVPRLDRSPAPTACGFPQRDCVRKRGRSNSRRDRKANPNPCRADVVVAHNEKSNACCNCRLLCFFQRRARAIRRPNENRCPTSEARKPATGGVPFTHPLCLSLSHPSLHP